MIHLLPNAIKRSTISLNLADTGLLIALNICSVPASSFKIGLSTFCKAVKTSSLTKLVELESIVTFACGQYLFRKLMTSSTIPDMSG